MGFNGDLYPSNASIVMTTKGDMVDYDTERQRLGIGSTGQVLTVASSLPTWATLTTADSVLTTQGDILYESASGLARLGQSTDGFVLTTKGAGANPVWASAGGGATAETVNATITSDFTTTSSSGVVITGIVITLPTITDGKCLIVFSGVFNRDGSGGLQNYLTTDSTGSDVAIAGTGRGAEGNHSNSRWDLATQAIHDADGSDISCFCFTGGNTLTVFGDSGAELGTSISALGVG